MELLNRKKGVKRREDEKEGGKKGHPPPLKQPYKA